MSVNGVLISTFLSSPLSSFFTFTLQPASANVAIRTRIALLRMNPPLCPKQPLSKDVISPCARPERPVALLPRRTFYVNMIRKTARWGSGCFLEDYRQCHTTHSHGRKEAKDAMTSRVTPALTRWLPGLSHYLRAFAAATILPLKR